MLQIITAVLLIWSRIFCGNKKSRFLESTEIFNQFSSIVKMNWRLTLLLKNKLMNWKMKTVKDHLACPKNWWTENSLPKLTVVNSTRGHTNSVLLMNYLRIVWKCAYESFWWLVYYKYLFWLEGYEFISDTFQGVGKKR